ncbi:hypothetical protein, partial [Phyllobacterium salinisoli]|uniref:hypothetical protein n=1 Tax=Phyllobacterium salinisoli TaxID=1899321 RepID=UPI00190F867C
SAPLNRPAHHLTKVILDPRFVDPDHLTHHSILLVVHPFAPSVFVEGAVKSESAKDSLRYRGVHQEGRQIALGIKSSQRIFDQIKNELSGTLNSSAGKNQNTTIKHLGNFMMVGTEGPEPPGSDSIKQIQPDRRFLV